MVAAPFKFCNAHDVECFKSFKDPPHLSGLPFEMRIVLQALLLFFHVLLFFYVVSFTLLHQPWLFDVVYKSFFTYLRLLTVKNKGSHLDPPLKNSGAQQRGLQQTVCKVLELYPQEKRSTPFPFTYIH